MAEKFTADEVAKAITEASGILTAAARILGCSRTTVHRYVNQYATVKAAYEEANESMIDFAEQQLFKNIKAGKEASIFFFLKTKAKHRGYVERAELTGKDGGAIETKTTVNDEGYHRAISTLADAIRESLSGTGTNQGGPLDSAKQTTVVGVPHEG